MRTVAMMLLAALISCATAVAQTTAPSTAPATQPGPERWEPAIEAFERRDHASPPPKDAVLFIGSSSIRGWKLEHHFPDLDTINRGFGGSQISDSVYYAGRIVLPYRPQAIVFYAGENDIVAGKSPKEVADDFQKFVSKVRDELPEVKIIFIGLKPSPSRWRWIDDFRETNALIRAFTEAQPRIVFIDVEPAMLNDQGRPREELFLQDRLHLTPAGYELWSDLVRPHVEERPSPG